MLLSHSTPKVPTSDKNSQTTRPNDAMMDPVVIEMLTFDMQKKIQDSFEMDTSHRDAIIY